MKKSNSKEEEDDIWFTPKRVLVYCIIIGLVSGILSILIDWLIVLSAAAFVFASITLWYMFGQRLHKWEERKTISKTEQMLFNLFHYLKRQIRFTKVKR